VTSANLGDGKMAVLTVTAVKDGDFGALTEQDRTTIRSQLARRMGSEEFEHCSARCAIRGIDRI
jgi:hypothetical protein